MAFFNKEITAEYLNQGSENCLPGELGVEVVEVRENVVETRMEVRSIHMAINGYLHAASVIALADTSCGHGVRSHLPQGAKGFTTIEVKCNFLGTVREGVVLCTATAQHLGRNTQVWDAEVRDGTTGKRIALFRCTQMVLWPK